MRYFECCNVVLITIYYIHTSYLLSNLSGGVKTIKSFKKYFLVLTLSLLFICGNMFSPIAGNTFGYNLTSTNVISAKGSHSSGSVKSGSFSAPKSSSSGTKSGSFSNSTNSSSGSTSGSSSVNRNGSSGSRWSFIPIPFFFGGGSGYGSPFSFIGSFFKFIILIIVVIVIINVIKKSKRKK